ncbi:c-type cytochrome [Allorhizobium borbori]|uniref:Cytochrome c n=1 Tax=Allorhizobium borbori TaxID=485907 RepID=A0A7W6K0Z2_9HYPH|nr:cytochrome c family protein [Allorhizobium borbori]MBB4103092.1 cytochrome c [Allorhizobium borbori]
MRIPLIALAVTTAFSMPALADGDAVEGAAVFKKQCSACHTATEDKNKVGPSLHNLIGRNVATVDGFKYSPGMIEFGAAGKVWDEALLGQYLPKPKDLVKGTRMAFAGLKSPEEIADLIAYLKNPAP